MNKEHNYRHGIDYTEVEKLYRQGMSDPEIGLKLGCSGASVRQWRKKNGHPAHYNKSSQMLALYKQGFTDLEIATKLGISTSRVSNFRFNYDLPPNKGNILVRKPTRGFSQERFEQLYKEGLSDIKIAELMNVHKATIYNRRKALGMPALHRGRARLFNN